ALHIGHSHLRLEPAADDGQAETGAPAADDDIGLADEDAGPSAPPAAAAPAGPAPPGRLLKRLLVVDGAGQGRFFYLPEAGPVTIGSGARNADIVLHDLYVARVHCEVETKGDQVVVTHVEGQHGTLVNGQRIAEQQELRLNDVLRVGNSHLRLEVVV